MSHTIAKMMVSLFVVVLLSACQQTTGHKTIIDEHASQNALDWAGVYSGTIPCASCPGIKTRIVIQEDGQFSKETHYLDNPGVFTETGQIVWDNTGRNITLSVDGSDEVNHYWVVENALVQLDQQQQKITGDIASHYRLQKTQMQLNTQPWQLMTIADKALADKLGDKLSERVNIIFDVEDKVSGQAPCNRYFASWQQTDQQLSIDKVGATKMACPYLQEEQQFFAQLAKVDNFEIKQNILLLKQGDEILLSFKAAFDSENVKN